MGQSLIVDQAVGPRRSDRLFVKTLSIELAVLDTGDFGTDQCGTAIEVLGAVFRPAHELRMVGAEHLEMSRPVLGGCRTVARCPRERSIEMVFGLLELDC